MEGIQFLWIAWSVWLVVFFFNKLRRVKGLRVILLFIIALFPYSFQVGDVFVNGSFIICLIYSSYLLIDETPLRKSYYFLISVTITCAAVAFQLFEIYDPVTLFLNRTFMLVGIVVALVLTLPMARERRIPVLMMGLVQAEFIYKDIMARLMLERTIGDAAFFDVLSLTIFLVLLWQAFEVFTLRMSESLSHGSQSTVKSSVGEY